MLLERDNLKFINERKALFLALSCAVGIYLGGVFTRGGSVLWLALPLFILGFCFRRKTVLLAALILVLSLGFTVGHLDMRSFSSVEGTHEVSGVVVNTTSSYVVLDQVTIDGERERGKVRLYADAELGDRVTCTAHLQPPSENRFLGEYGNGVRFVGSAFDIQTQSEFHLFLSLRLALKDALFLHMDEGEASLGYALLTGDTSAIESDVLENVRYGGIAHLFAVSGLHIGILYGVLIFATAKARRARPFIIPPLLFFYAGICSFSPSSVRAALMCSFSCLNRYFGRKSDALELLGLACLSMLIFVPSQIYRVGFRLSVLACAGISLLSPYFTFECLPERVAKILSSTLAAQLAVFPVLMDTFGYVSAASLILNFLFVPLMTPLMVFLLLGLLLSPVSAFFLLPAQGLLRGFLFLMNVSDFSVFLIEGFTFGLFALPYYFGLVVGAGTFNLTKPLRIFLASVLLVSSAFGVMLTSDAVYDCKIVTSEGGTLVCTREVSLLILTEESVETQTLLRKNRGVKSVDVLFLDGERELSFAVKSVYTDRYDGAFTVSVCEPYLLVRYKEVSVLVGAEESDAFLPLSEGKLVLLGDRIYYRE